MSSGSAYDVVVIGEALVEFSSPQPLSAATEFVRSFSGDALNAAAAAAAAGARTALVTRVGEDDFGDALCRHAAELGIDISQVRRTAEPNGIYFTAVDPQGARSFVYHRRGSAAAGLTPADLDPSLLTETAVLLVSGVGCAISPSSEATVYEAAKTVARTGGQVVFDPNFRSQLCSTADARRHLRDLSPLARVVTPSCPHDTEPLLGTDDPVAAAEACVRAGATLGVVTCGERGIVMSDGSGPISIPAAAAETVVDATGCGDAFTGALAAGIATAAPLDDAIQQALAMAGRCLAHRGGTGYLETAVMAGATPDHLPGRATAHQQPLSTHNRKDPT